MKFSLKKYNPNQRKGLECLNCGQPLTGNENFCTYCGQKNTTAKLTIGNFINSLFSGFLSYDSRFWATFIPLLTKPGKVSKQYIEGKRARFVNPFQLYLNVSIIFFLIVGISNKFSTEVENENAFIQAKTAIDSLSQNEKKQLDSVLTNIKEEVIKVKELDSSKAEIAANFETALALSKLTDTSSAKKKYEYFIKKEPKTAISFINRVQDFHHFYNENTTYSVEKALDSLGYEKTFWNKMYYQQTINSNKNFKKYKTEGQKAFFKAMTSYVSISLFIFLPFFTLFLKLICFRKKYTYIEHLVFVFHVQTVFFLLLSIFYFINLFTKTDGFLVAFIVLFAIYLYKALRYFYEQSRIRTILKFILLNSFYMVLAGFGFVIIAILSFIVG
ncbi:DUF3667 domain-containing protein [Lutibacter sp.]|uniref:DUF3667 domain-containing protein n=1 Tax=Lutibacter sp. TaxID=1925666 RepID=UPI001A1A069E|nr:DUF3667 domain-containing protein [Lutibacter sp.]MBI9040428.1 DUF3667 domain-containing protein [Lutibacter sp.]